MQNGETEQNGEMEKNEKYGIQSLFVRNLYILYQHILKHLKNLKKTFVKKPSIIVL